DVIAHEVRIRQLGGAPALERDPALRPDFRTRLRIDVHCAHVDSLPCAKPPRPTCRCATPRNPDAGARRYARRRTASTQPCAGWRSRPASPRRAAGRRQAVQAKPLIVLTIAPAALQHKKP